MHKMIEIAQLLERGMSQRQIASSLHVSRRTIKRVEETLSSSKLSVQSLQGMSEKELQGIFPNQKEGMDEIYYKPDFDSLVKELRKPVYADVSEPPCPMLRATLATHRATFEKNEWSVIEPHLFGSRMEE